MGGNKDMQIHDALEMEQAGEREREINWYIEADERASAENLIVSFLTFENRIRYGGIKYCILSYIR